MVRRVLSFCVGECWLFTQVPLTNLTDPVFACLFQTADIQAVPAEDPYSEFLASQKKREKEWRANRRDAKKAKLSVPSTAPCPASGTDGDSEDVVLELRKQLAEKNTECSRLRIKLENTEESLKKQMEIQESVLKVRFL